MLGVRLDDNRRSPRGSGFAYSPSHPPARSSPMVASSMWVVANEKDDWIPFVLREPLTVQELRARLQAHPRRRQRARFGGL